MFSFLKKSSSSCNLKAATIEQILNELRERGFEVHVEGEALTISRSENVPIATNIFAILRAMDDYLELERHRHDRDRTPIQYWTYFQAHDLERKPPGHCIDADKSIGVGMAQYNKYEDAEQSQILLIQHFDTERPGNFVSKNDYKPVWAVALSTSEMEKFIDSNAAALKSGSTLIHREPTGPIKKDEPWWQESHWLVERNSVVGLRLLIKCTQDSVAREHLVRFNRVGNAFHFIEAVDVPTAAVEASSPDDINASVYPSLPLPAPANDIIPDMAYLSDQCDVEMHEPEGDCALEMRISAGETKIEHYEQAQHLLQSITSALLTITNPTAAQIGIKEYWVDIQNHDGEWIRSTSAVGTMHDGYNCKEVRYFDTVQSFEIDAHASLDLVFKGTSQIPLGGHVAYAGRYGNRVHSAFPHPFKARVNIKDDRNMIKSLQFEHSNAPLDNIWTTYEDAVLSCGEGTGFGSNYTPDMWLCVENPLTLLKCVICITHESEKDAAGNYEYIIRLCNDSRKIGGSCSFASSQTFKDLAYQNQGKTEIDVGFGTNENCSLTGLIDETSGVMYCLHGQVRVTSKTGEVIAFSESYMNL